MAPKRELKPTPSDDSDVQFVPNRASRSFQAPAFNLASMMSSGGPPASTTRTPTMPSGIARTGTSARSAASTTRADLMPEPVHSSDDSSQKAAPFQYLIEGDSYASYRSQTFEIHDSVYPPESYYPDNQLGLLESPPKMDYVADTQMDADSDALPQDDSNPELHRGFAHEDLSPVLEECAMDDCEEMETLFLAEKGSPIPEDAYASAAYDATPEVPDHGVTEPSVAASPPSPVESLEVEDSPKPVDPTQGLESPQETPAVVSPERVEKKKCESGGSAHKRKAPKAKAKTQSKAKAKAKAKGQGKGKAKKAPGGPAKPKGNMKKKDEIERKLHSVYSCAHSHASKVAKMSKEDAKKMAHDARREWILKNGVSDHPAARRYLSH